MTIEGISARDFHRTVEPAVSTVRRFFRRVKELILSDGFRSGALKLTRNALTLHDKISNSTPFATAQTGLNGTIDFLKLASIPQKIHEIRETKKDKLKLAALTIGVVSDGLTAFKVLELFKAIELAKFAALLGKIPVVGSTVAKILPFGNIITILDTIKAGMDIAISSKAIHSCRKKLANNKEKRALWEGVKQCGTFSEDFISAKIKRMDAKFSSKYAKMNVALAKEEIAIAKLMAKTEAYDQLQEDIATASGGAKKKLQLKSVIAKRKLHSLARREIKAVKELEAAQGKIDHYLKTRKDWMRLKKGEVEQPTQGDVKKFAEIKLEKWAIKRKKDRGQVKEESAKICLNTVLMVCYIASMVLAALAIAAIPGVGIALTLGFCIPLSIGIGMTIWKKFRKEKTYKPVPISMILGNPA